jgi:hypothetical protein
MVVFAIQNKVFNRFKARGEDAVRIRGVLSGDPRTNDRTTGKGLKPVVPRMSTSRNNGLFSRLHD